MLPGDSALSSRLVGAVPLCQLPPQVEWRKAARTVKAAATGTACSAAIVYRAAGQLRTGPLLAGCWLLSAAAAACGGGIAKASCN